MLVRFLPSLKSFSRLGPAQNSPQIQRAFSVTKLSSNSMFSPSRRASIHAGDKSRNFCRGCNSTEFCSDFKELQKQVQEMRELLEGSTAARVNSTFDAATIRGSFKTEGTVDLTLTFPAGSRLSVVNLDPPTAAPEDQTGKD